MDYEIVEEISRLFEVGTFVATSAVLYFSLLSGLRILMRNLDWISMLTLQRTFVSLKNFQVKIVFNPFSGENGTCCIQNNLCNLSLAILFLSTAFICFNGFLISFTFIIWNFFTSIFFVFFLGLFTTIFFWNFLFKFTQKYSC